MQNLPRLARILARLQKKSSKPETNHSNDEKLGDCEQTQRHDYFKKKVMNQ
jgi:hypothetical protein